MQGSKWFFSTTEDLNTRNEPYTISPNPAKDYIIVEGINSDVEYIIFNMTGTMIQQGRSDNSSTIYFSNLPKGIYILQLTTHENKMMSKFIITQ